MQVKNVLKRIGNAKLIVGVMALAGVVIFASHAGTSTVVDVNGSQVGEAYVSGGVTYVPVQPIVQKMGGTFAWNSKVGQATIREKNGTIVILKNNWSMSVVNGHPIPLETKTINKVTVPVNVKSIMHNGSLYVPVDFVSATKGFNFPVKTTTASGKTTIYVGTVPAPAHAPAPQQPSNKPKPSNPAPSNNQGGGATVLSQRYADGWTAPVLKSSWSASLTSQQKRDIFQNELGLTGGVHYDIQGAYDAFDIGQDYGTYEAKVSFSMWGPDHYDPSWNPAQPTSYRVPVVAKQVFKFYFGNDADRVWNYFNSGNIPDQFTANGRLVKGYYDNNAGKAVLRIGFPGKSFN